MSLTKSLREYDADKITFFILFVFRVENITFPNQEQNEGKRDQIFNGLLVRNIQQLLKKNQKTEKNFHAKKARS